jgi:hypothetical protein
MLSINQTPGATLPTTYKQLMIKRARLQLAVVHPPRLVEHPQAGNLVNVCLY